jgi:hypothetical protein
MTYAELVQKIRDYTEVDANVLTDTICRWIYSRCRMENMLEM